MKQIFTPDFYKSLVERNADVVAVIDQGGVYKYISDAAEAVLAFTTEELTGKNSYSFVHEAERASLQAALQAVPLQENTLMPLFRFRTGNGTWKWLEARATNLLADDAVNGIVINLRDLTDRVEATSGFTPGQAYYHSLFQNNPDAVFILDSSGSFKKVNPLVEEVFGYSKPELQDTPLLEYMHANCVARARKSIRKALGGEALKVKLVILTKQQKEVYLNLTMVPVLVQGVAVGLQCIAKDVTKHKEAKELLRKKAEQLNTVIESIADPYIVLDEAWRFTFVNPAFEAYFGKGAPELNGQVLWEHTPELNKPLFYEQCLEVAATGSPAYFEETFAGLGGSANTMSVSVFPFLGGISVFFRDVSFEKGLEAEFEKLSMVASKTTNGIIILNNIRKIEWINSGFTRLTGYSLTDALQRNPGELLRGPGTDQSTADRIEEKLAQGIPFSEEVLNYHKSGEEIWLKLNIIPILSEKRQLAKYIIILTDITDKKLTEHKLLQLAADLYKHNKDLQQFTYIVSHNLRAPVANAVGLTNLLLKFDKETPIYEQALQNLKVSLSKLDNVLTDLNSVLTIRDSAHTTAKEEVSLQKVCLEVIASLQQNLEETGSRVELAIPADTTVYTNKAYIYSILYSLLTNALKFRSESRPLKVCIKCKKYRNKGTAISIADNGLGMDMDKIKDHIFTLYSRFHPHIEGKGIGLFLVKAQVEAQGGKIKVNSKPDVGTTFTIFL